MQRNLAGSGRSCFTERPSDISLRNLQEESSRKSNIRAICVSFSCFRAAIRHPDGFNSIYSSSCPQEVRCKSTCGWLQFGVQQRLFTGFKPMDAKVFAIIIPQVKARSWAGQSDSSTDRGEREQRIHLLYFLKVPYRVISHAVLSWGEMNLLRARIVVDCADRTYGTKSSFNDDRPPSPTYRPLFITLLIGLILLVGAVFVLSGIQDAQAGQDGSLVFDKSKSWRPIQTSRPYNIAHRGANGQLPEETAPAYVRAIDVGADFIETDISATKDGVLICIHDVILDATTDVLNHTEFGDRVRTYEVEGVNVTGIFTVDLTLAEIKTLRCLQRWPFRDHSYDGLFQVITFEEYIAIALDAPRVVGIYPEIKDPVFVNKHVKWPGNKRFEDIFMETLLKYGYNGKYLSKQWLAQPVFIQSFAPTSLIYVSNFTTSPLIFLIDDVTVRTQDTNQTYEEITSDAYLDYISQYIAGIGPWKDTLDPSKDNYLEPPTDLVQRAHLRGLQVHPYTFRNENQFLHWNFVQDPYQEYQYWFNTMKVDGVFTDFTQSLALYQNWATPLK